MLHPPGARGFREQALVIEREELALVAARRPDHPAADLADVLDLVAHLRDAMREVALDKVLHE